MSRPSDNHHAELHVLRSMVDTLTKKVDDQGAQIQELQTRRWPVQQVMVVAALGSFFCALAMLLVALNR
ncbi:hypothetical protein ACFY0B_18265 [Streptomyces sp. NPDC001797]|uniref:hypothetical protein n=1 Tax=unclassified Streptomyces TaxID=2593676 RepID=UPI003693183B